MDNRSDLFMLIISNDIRIEFVVPDFALLEITQHQEYICKKTKTSIIYFSENLCTLLSCITVLSDDEIDDKTLLYARNLASTIDPDDTIFIAFALALDTLLWTGDRKLINGLTKAGFNLAITSKQLKDIIKGL